MILLITYDLNKPGQDYSTLYEEIKKAGYWWHHLDSTWIIRTEESPTHWYNRLSRHLDKNDFILIFELKPDYWGYLPNEAWEWLKKRFSEEGYY